MTLMLLDAASLYYRAYYGVPEAVTAPDGMPVNAIRGFLDMTASLVTTYGPDRLVACLDNDWRPAFRVAALPSYKAHRLATGSTVAEDTPDTLAPQVPILLTVLDALGIARVGADGFEADDVIATLATREPGPVDIVTGDRDLFQLVRDDQPVRVLYTARSVRKLDVIDEAAVQSRYGIPGRSYADFAVLRGDPSDGLSGVPGVGDKTAASLITTFGDLATVRGAAQTEEGSFPAGARAKIRAAGDYLDVAPLVVLVRTDAPVPAVGDALPAAPADPGALLDLADRYGLSSSVERVLRACQQ